MKMFILFDNPDRIFLVLGTLFSLFYGAFARSIFTYPHTDKDYKEHNIPRYGQTLSTRLHNHWINFLGSATGWFCFFLLYNNLFSSGIHSFTFSGLNFGHLVVFAIGLLGVMGFLPLTFWGLATSIDTALKKLK